MNIVKQNETFNLTDTTSSGWEVTGNFSKSVEGNYDLNISVQKNMESIGFATYSNNSGQISLNYNCSEELRDEMATYIDTVVDTVLAYKGE